MRDSFAIGASWLATLLVHSTLWLGGVALFLRLRPRAPARLRDFLWRAALAASLLTPVAQVVATEGCGWSPLGGALRFGGAAESAGAVAAPSGAPSLQLLVLAEYAAEAGVAGGPVIGSAPTLAAGEPRAAGSGAESVAWPELLVGAWALLALLGLGALARGTLRFRRALGAREPVGECASARALRRLVERGGRRARGIRLTASEELRVPVALGAWRREICVPQRALRDLPPPQQRAMIGHEFAHLLRRDPAWFGLFEVARRAFFFQPLFALAQRGAHEAAEELCDAWAARRTGDPVALAECLVEVARWLEARPRRGAPPLAAACMTRPASPLARRVDALLAGDVDEEPRPQRRLLAGALVLPLALTALAPGFDAAPVALSPAARLALVEGELAAAQAELEAARDDAAALGRSGRLAGIERRLAGLRAQADRLATLIER